MCKNVRDSGLALEVLGSKCPRLRALKLGQFHGICSAIGSELDGIALCSGLSRCCKLVKFEVQGCKGITVKGLRTMASLLRKTLEDEHARNFDLNQVNDDEAEDVNSEASVLNRNGEDRDYMDLNWGPEYEHRSSKKCKLGLMGTVPICHQAMDMAMAMEMGFGVVRAGKGCIIFRFGLGLVSC
ncbi:hypothetical protein GBA52_010287 [Prunus armeniaca]|nr:hypothetical protein GBA52_010287 [Prunus armeniaca]